MRTIQHRHGLQVACLKEIAFLQGLINRDQLIARGKLFSKSAYRKNLLRFADEPKAHGELTDT